MTLDKPHVSLHALLGQVVGQPDYFYVAGHHKTAGKIDGAWLANLCPLADRFQSFSLQKGMRPLALVTSPALFRTNNTSGGSLFN